MRNLDGKEWLEILRRASGEGKEAILRNYNPASRRKIVKRGVGGDLTLKIDEVSEEAIHRSLLKDLGKNNFVFVSEELGETTVVGDEPRPVVVCDPLDGSHNAQVGIPAFCLSLSVLGLKKKLKPTDKRRFGDVDAALILSIKTDDEYAALKGGGSFHNGERIQNQDLTKNLARERIRTLGVECGDIEYLKKLISKLDAKKVYKFRVLGSAALSLSYLAEGSLDALIFAQPGGARTIDSPAGYLIAREAGCFFAELSSTKKRNSTQLDSAEVGFRSKLNMIGARKRKILQELSKLVS